MTNVIKYKAFPHLHALYVYDDSSIVYGVILPLLGVYRFR